MAHEFTKNEKVDTGCSSIGGFRRTRSEMDKCSVDLQKRPSIRQNLAVNILRGKVPSRVIQMEAISPNRAEQMSTNGNVACKPLIKNQTSALDFMLEKDCLRSVPFPIPKTDETQMNFVSSGYLGSLDVYKSTQSTTRQHSAPASEEVDPVCAESAFAWRPFSGGVYMRSPLHSVSMATDNDIQEIRGQRMAARYTRPSQVESTQWPQTENYDCWSFGSNLYLPKPPTPTPKVSENLETGWLNYEPPAPLSPKAASLAQDAKLRTQPSMFTRTPKTVRSPLAQAPPPSPICWQNSSDKSGNTESLHKCDDPPFSLNTSRRSEELPAVKRSLIKKPMLLKKFSEPTQTGVTLEDSDSTCRSSLRRNHNTNVGVRKLRKRLPWASFYEESVVPDLPVPLERPAKAFQDEPQATGKKDDAGGRALARITRLSTSKSSKLRKASVTWQDSAEENSKSLSIQTGKEIQTSLRTEEVMKENSDGMRMDDLINVLTELCDSIEKYSLLGGSLHIPSMEPVGMAKNQVSLEAQSRLERRRNGILNERKEKVIVEVRVVFLKIGEIDTLKEFYQADAFLQAKWREPRLDGKTTEELCSIDLDRYWNPMCYIDNILSETKEVQWLSTQARPNGEVYIVDRRRIKGVFLETLELNDFPLDVQDLTITVTTERPDTEVDLIPDHNEMSAINSQTFVDQQEWKLHEHVEITKRVITQEYSRSMQSHPCISVTCRAARRPGYFYWNVFLIMFMISGLAFATFAVSPDKAELRLRLSFTLILTSVTFKYVITQSLPRISYLTYMDKYVLMSLAILCIISIWHAVITILPIKTMQPNSTVPGSNTTPNATSLSWPLGDNSSDFLRQHQQLDTAGINKNNPGYLLHEWHLRTYADGSREASSKSSSNRFSNKIRRSRGVEIGEFTLTDEMVSLYFLGLLRAYMHVQDQMDTVPDIGQIIAHERLEVMKRLEQDVFISFAVLYIIAHCIFVFWLYFDASRRRREMRRKDREYRQFLRKNHQWRACQKQPQRDNISIPLIFEQSQPEFGDEDREVKEEAEERARKQRAMEALIELEAEETTADSEQTRNLVMVEDL